MKFRIYITILALSIIGFQHLMGQGSKISGFISSEEGPARFVNISNLNSSFSTMTDTAGYYKLSNIPEGTYDLQITGVGFETLTKKVVVAKDASSILNFLLTKGNNTLNDVVVTGTLKAVRRTDSPVNVEVYTPSFFKKNPTPNIYEALQNVNGVRPQLNCNVCNTGDIHINGLEGPYTMVLLDGMPIVSALSTVYGLSGIPNALVERIEVVKGPASSLYGSEAVGGLINIITKDPNKAPMLSTDIFFTTSKEYNADVSFKVNAADKASILTGINYFNFQNIIDKNHDNFTDMTLQNRISLFQKWDIKRKNNRQFSLAGRYMYEDRWGGDLRYDSSFRGGDSIYGESIYTNRWELLGNYELPFTEKMMLSFSYNEHEQDSRYGKTSYIASQKIGFTQLTWDKNAGNHDLLFGIALRYTYYDDNTPTTQNADMLKNKNAPHITWLPGIFAQDEIALSKKHKILLGMRYDYNSYHGNILTPRFAYKWAIDPENMIRLNAGTGYRVVNLFTEDHAALTGAREVIVANELNPERSYNVNLNYIRKFFIKDGTYLAFDLSTFYTYFNNRIVADLEQDPNKIIYDNLQGYALSKGINLNMDISFPFGLQIIAGGTWMENTLNQNGVRTQQLLTEKFTGTWAVSYTYPKSNISIDYTGNVYSPMRLPLLSSTDPRSPSSPWWSIQNIQLTYTGLKKVEFYFGIKNLLNWTPNKGNPFIIARAHDPFDKKVNYDANGQILATSENPYALSFDPTYIYGPNQGIRGFFGVRFRIIK